MTPDVNVLVAAFLQEHVHHAAARAWLLQACAQSANGTPLRLTPLVMGSFVRLVTNPRVFSVPATTEQAIEFLDAILAIPGVTLLETPTPWPLLRRMCLEKSLTGNALPDAMLAATVLHSTEVLASFDRDLVQLLPPSHLQMLNT